MPQFTDQLGRTITIPHTPKRIISLVPSQTELLASLGLDDSVVGITKFCIRPNNWFRHKTRVGGTKTLNHAAIRALHPDLILANKEENDQQQLEALMQAYPVWVSDIANLDDALDMLHAVGALCACSEKAAALANNIQLAFAEWQAQIGNASEKQLPVCYLIWKDPYYAVGGDTFIHDMLTRCGFRNIMAEKKRYPAIDIDHLRHYGSDLLLLLSSEPFPFNEDHREQLAKRLPQAKIILVDGEMFSWYGSRLLAAPAYFRQLLSQQQLLSTNK